MNQRRVRRDAIKRSVEQSFHVVEVAHDETLCELRKAGPGERDGLCTEVDAEHLVIGPLAREVIDLLSRATAQDQCATPQEVEMCLDVGLERETHPAMKVRRIGHV